jgi:DtxR family Mn-dependent transcriptional regulator
MDHRKSKEQRLEEDRIDEVLESIWMLMEDGEATADKVIKRAEDPQTARLLKEIESAGLISMDHGSGGVSFKEAGKRRAEEIIRRHRIAERLLSEIFELDERQMEDHACELEHTHVLGQVVVDSICTSADLSSRKGHSEGGML